MLLSRNERCHAHPNSHRKEPVAGNNPTRVVDALFNKGSNLVRSGRPAEGEPVLREALVIFLKETPQAWNTLEQQDFRKSHLVKLPFFAGLTTAQAAQALGVSVATADNDWAYAWSWLRLEMGGNRDASSRP